MSHVIWSFASGIHLLGFFVLLLSFEAGGRKRPEWAEVLQAFLLKDFVGLLPSVPCLEKQFFFKVDFHREALSTTQRKYPIQFPSLFPESLTLEFTALKSWSLNQTFLLLNSNYSGYFWFKVQCIMIAILISMLISFIVLCFDYWGGSNFKILMVFCAFSWLPKGTYLSGIHFLIYNKCFFTLFSSLQAPPSWEELTSWISIYWEPTGCLPPYLSLSQLHASRAAPQAHRLPPVNLGAAAALTKWKPNVLWGFRETKFIFFSCKLTSFSPLVSPWLWLS